MTICKFVLIAAAVALSATTLSACASMEGTAPAPSASLQNAVYVTGNNAALTQVNATSDEQKPTTVPSGESKAMRFYWFLGGR